MMFKTKIRLPISVEEYDNLTSRLCKKYKFSDKDHVAAVISVAIRHLPNEQAYSTLDYLAGCVYKQMANHVANHKGELIKHTVQVDNLIAMFKQDPNNQQILDELRKYADNGFEYAKNELAKLEGTAALSLVPAQPIDPPSIA